MRFARAWIAMSWLAFRRQLWSMNTLMILAPLAACAGLLMWLRIDRQAFSPSTFNDFSQFLLFVFVAMVTPLCALAYGTAAVGAEREDGTLLFLLVRPLPRTAILLAKYAAVLPLALGLVVGSFRLYCRLAGETGEVARWLYEPAVVYSALAYSALFCLFSVAFRHATVIALVYAVFVEFLLGNMPGLIKRLAVNYYSRSMMYAAGESEGLRTPDPEWFEPISPAAAQWTLVGIAIVAIILALAIFQRAEYREAS